MLDLHTLWVNTVQERVWDLKETRKWTCVCWSSIKRAFSKQRKGERHSELFKFPKRHQTPTCTRSSEQPSSAEKKTIPKVCSSEHVRRTKYFWRQQEKVTWGTLQHYSSSHSRSNRPKWSQIVSNNSMLAESWKTHHELTFAWQTTIKLKRKMKQKDTKQAENHQWLKEIYLSVVILNGNGSS